MAMDNTAVNYYFERYLQASPFSHALWRSLEATAVASVKLEHPILDMGCGFGEFAGAFSETTIECGIDISKDIVIAAQLGNYGKLLVADAHKLPFDEHSFSSVMSISVLEHIEGVQTVFHEVFRALKPGGVLVFTVPTSAINEILVVPAWLRRIGLERLATTYMKVFHSAFRHVTLMRANEWAETVRKAGFEVERIEGTISRRQLFLYELGIPTALITQISKVILGRRLPFRSEIRVRSLYFAATRLLHILSDNDPTEANIMVVARKPVDKGSPDKP
jgi:ubiquinone/menaquinone biosynthesis C-methylase UbiE